MVFQPQKGKQGTKGAKQIVDENAATLKFYQYMAAGSTTLFFILNFLFFEFTGTVSVSGLIQNPNVLCFIYLFCCSQLLASYWIIIYFVYFQVMAFLSVVILLASYQFMAFMSKAKYSETGALLDSGNDLNMEGGIAEYVFNIGWLVDSMNFWIMFDIYLSFFLQECQRSDYSMFRHSSPIIVIKLVLVLIIVSTFSCHLHALGISDTAMAKSS